MSSVKVLILTGYGINSDYELAECFNRAGGSAERVHINDLADKKRHLSEFDILAFPGGFSFGDHIASGRVFASKIKSYFGEALLEAAEKQIPMMGICNGFQTLVKLGLLPGDGLNPYQQTATLTFNDSGRFEDRWCHLKTDTSSPCIWTKDMDTTYLPVRHGEGKFVATSQETLDSWKQKGMICLRYCNAEGNAPTYPENPNGSMDDVAGICSENGLIFGLMPHPEAFMDATNHPKWTRLGLKGEGWGMPFFRNAVEHVKG